MKQLLTIVFIGLVGFGYGQLTDARDGKIYKTFEILGQEWLAENLAYKPSSGNYWAYDDDDTNVAKYGYLYDWETACKVCPDGWHLPSHEEWMYFIQSLTIGPEAAGSKMKSTSGWKDGVNGTNKSGFNGLPGGYLNENGGFEYIGYIGGWWSSKEDNANDAWFRLLYFNDFNVGTNHLNKTFGFSVRCIKD